MKCTNCFIETDKSNKIETIGDIHCRIIFKKEFEKMLNSSELSKAIDYYQKFIFKDNSSNDWKKDKYGKEFEKLIKQEAFKKIQNIKLKIKNKILLNENEISILRKNKKNEWLGFYFKQLYQLDKNMWHLVSASSYYRDADEPENSLKLTNNIDYGQDKKLISALYTTRGGAYRDLNKLDDAIECAERAIKAKESYHPYNLLGGIYIQKEFFNKAEECFEKAIELHSNGIFIHQEIQRASLHLSSEAKKEMNKFFKNKYLVFKK